MSNVLSKDAEYSDFHLDLSLNEKRLVRAAVKTYHTTVTYFSLKLFKRDSEQVDWDFNQKITFSAREFRLICQNIEKLEQMLDQPVGLIDSLLNQIQLMTQNVQRNELAKHQLSAKRKYQKRL